MLLLPAPRYGHVGEAQWLLSLSWSDVKGELWEGALIELPSPKRRMPRAELLSSPDLQRF